MSRKLDALFAERVLGCTNVAWTKGLSGEPQPTCNCEESLMLVHYSSSDGPVFRYLPAYRESLDAAWQGVEKVLNAGKGNDRHIQLIQYNVSSECIVDVCEVRFDVDVDSPPVDKIASARSKGYSTPALAIVKACLLAVGVTQEEIDACA